MDTDGIDLCLAYFLPSVLSSVVAASVKYTGRVSPVTLCVSEQL